MIFTEDWQAEEQRELSEDRSLRFSSEEHEARRIKGRERILKGMNAKVLNAIFE